LTSVVVIGGGVAGTAAALGAAQVGASVTLIAGGRGASALSGGAIDDIAWDEPAGISPDDLAPLARAVLDALGGYRVGARRTLHAVTTGLLRPARGCDAALLDLEPLAGRTILVPDIDHAAWDAETLASAWSATPHARELRLGFVAGRAPIFRRSEERSFTEAEVAMLHDDPARLSWLAARLREARAAAPGDATAIVLPRWLGVSRERATDLSNLVGFPCGEALGGVGGPSGLRFEQSRKRALEIARVIVVDAWATRVSESGSSEQGWRVELAHGEAPAERIGADAVVLATGGILGGGLEYTPAGSFLGPDVPEVPRPLLRATCEAPVRLGARGVRLDDPSSLFGAAPETHAWPYVEEPLLDHAGVLVRGHGEVIDAPSGLFATGELAAGPAHTWLRALAHGAKVGAFAAGQHVGVVPN